MDGFGRGQHGDQPAVTIWRVPIDHDAGPPFAGSDITVDGARRDLVHDAHYLVRREGRGAIRCYCAETDTLRHPNDHAAPLSPPFDVVGRIVRLVQSLD